MRAMSLSVGLLLLVASPAFARQVDVRYATTNTAYFDAGAKDGVAVGDELTVMRRKRKVGSCVVESVAPGHASCKFGGAERGDRVVVASRPASSSDGTAKAELLKPVPSRELQHRRMKVEAHVAQKVEHKKIVRTSRTARAEMTLRHQSTFHVAGDGHFERPTLYARGRAAPAFLQGAFAGAALRVRSDVLAPSGQRFRPDDIAEVYVDEAVVGYDGALMLWGQVGRFMPRLPSMAMVDGGQVGLKLLGGAVDAGVYAGSIPDLVTVYPAVARLTGGAYANAAINWLTLSIRPRARAGVTASPDGRQVRGELASDVQVLWESVAVGGLAKVSLAQDGKLALDQAQTDASVTLFDRLHTSLLYAYFSPPATDLDAKATAATSVFAQQERHRATATVGYDALSWLRLSGIAGVTAHDVGPRDGLHGWVGPEVSFPRAFLGHGGFSVGYIEELGQEAGRYAWTTLQVLPLDNVSTSLRLGTSMDALTLPEADATWNLSVRLFNHVDVRARLIVIQPVPALWLATQRAYGTSLMSDVAIGAQL